MTLSELSRHVKMTASKHRAGGYRVVLSYQGRRMVIDPYDTDDGSRPTAFGILDVMLQVMATVRKSANYDDWCQETGLHFRKKSEGMRLYNRSLKDADDLEVLLGGDVEMFLGAERF
jgi:hypothetical protein